MKCSEHKVHKKIKINFKNNKKTAQQTDTFTINQNRLAITVGYQKSILEFKVSITWLYQVSKKLNCPTVLLGSSYNPGNTYHHTTELLQSYGQAIWYSFLHTMYSRGLKLALIAARDTLSESLKI